MKHLTPIVILAAAVYFGFVYGLIPAQDEKSGQAFSKTTQRSVRDEKPAQKIGQPTQSSVAEFDRQNNNTQIHSNGRVIKILPDDNEGSRHQRFIIQLACGQTLLMAHNIDMAERVASIKVGDTVEFNGEYEWNSKGGVIHWTHRDPHNKHVSGWIKHRGRTYQ